MTDHVRLAFGALAWVAVAAVAQAPASAPDAQLGRVQVQGEANFAREKKTLAQLLKAQALFDQYHALAPEAPLRFRLYPRTQAESRERLALVLMLPQGRQPVTLDEDDDFVIDPVWRVLDPATELRSRLPDGRITWRPDIRTPGWPAGERRLGDLRLQCRIGFDSGVARGPSLLTRLLALGTDDCEERDWSPSNFADAPVFAVTLVHGDRRVTLSNRMLHGLKDGNGDDYDWGFLLRERMFRVPIGDTSWPDDTHVLLETVDDPPAPPDASLRELQDGWVQAALALRVGEPLDEAQAALGPALESMAFDSGRRLLRYEREFKGFGGTKKVELVLLFDPDGRLLKSELRRMDPNRRY